MSAEEGGDSDLLFNSIRKGEFRLTGFMKVTLCFTALVSSLALYMLHIFDVSQQCNNESPYLLVTSHSERNIVKIISEAYTPSRAAFELITLANLGGGGDNLSCIVLRFDEVLEGES